MALIVVRRRPRRAAPEVPGGELAVPAPPEVPSPPGGRWGQLLTLLPMLTGTVAAAMMFAGKQGGAYAYVIGGVFGISSLGMLATNFTGGGARRGEMTAARRDYLRQLSGLRRQVHQAADQQREGLHYRHPEPSTLWSAVDSHRLWERRPGDRDFAVVRVGLGPQALATPLVPPITGPVEGLEPMTTAAMRRFLDTYAVLPELPVSVAITHFARLYLTGPTVITRDLARAMLAQLAVFHAPEDVLVAVATTPDQLADWDHVKWLPHALHPRRTDPLGPLRLVATDAPALDRLLDDIIGNRPRFAPGVSSDGPHVVVILDGTDTSGCQHLSTDSGLAGVTIVDLTGTPPRLADRTFLTLAVDGQGNLHAGQEMARPDRLNVAASTALARQLAPLRLSASGGGDADADTEAGLADLLGIGDPEVFAPAIGWVPRPSRDRLRVPLGVDERGHPVELDLKESAQDGMGPHGLLVGATGSGKSELLRTLVLGLATTHDSATLNMVLIDFKGGATFASLDRLPHTAAVITNLHDELSLVDRMTDALNGELMRRQELLKHAGNYASIGDYERARAAGMVSEPLPVLLIICDEFSELLSAKPEFIETFVQIGRLGRSLGVHLLLASQRLEEGRLRGLETHLSYRIGLRTFSAMESRSVLGVPDAYELPRSPGHGFIRSGTEPLVRFKAAYVSGPYQRPGRVAGGGHRAGWPLPFTATPLPEPATHTPTAGATPSGGVVPVGATGPSLLDLLVDRLAGAGVPAHQVWLPPLSVSAALTDLIGPLVADPDVGVTVADPDARGLARVPVALIDKPFEQRRDPLWLDLSGASGHLAVVGGPRSGKSTVLLSVITGLALSHTPEQARFYCLDFGGGGLAAVRGLPHVGGVCGRQAPEAVRRTVGEMVALLATRERVGLAPDDPHVFLVIDGWSTLRGEFDDLELVVIDLATRGLAYRMHVLVCASRWMDLRPAIRDLFGAKLELRLGDPADSMISRKAAGNVPDGTPGRGLMADGKHFLTAAPPPAELISQITTAWPGTPAPPVRLLPALLPYDRLTALSPPGDADRNDDAIPIGLAEADLGPVSLDFSADPHALLFGDAESGKSSFLRALATSITQRYSPERARIIVVDYRRSLLGSVSGDQVIGYGSGAEQTAELIDSVAGYMRRRLPGPDVTPEQLRARSWWTGPDCYVLVDDYDLVASSGTNPLLPLLDFLAQARDIGLHLILTRRSGGASRALYEPVLQRLRELSTPGLVLSGDREEGALIGQVRPGPQPPGRGWLVTRKEGVRLVQLAYLPPS